MLRIVLALLLSGCAASTLVGASTMTAAAIGSSAMQRKSGGCYAVCTSGTTCNPRTGLCERMPCDGLCTADEHCEVTAIESKCVPGSPPSDVASRAPGTQRTLPVLPAPSPVEGGPPQVVPAAEKHPPTDKDTR